MGDRYEKPWWATGVITYAKILVSQGELDRVDRKIVKDCLDWFNAWVPVPPWTAMKSNGKWNPDMVCWFYSKARKPINRLRPEIKVLRVNGVRACTLTTNRPGKVVYRDGVQVVAITPPNA